MPSIFGNRIQVLLAIDGETLLLAHGYAKRVEIKRGIRSRYYASTMGVQYYTGDDTLILELGLTNIETLDPEMMAEPKQLPIHQQLGIPHEQE